MRWLSELVKHIVARVDDVIDRTRADRLEPAHEPCGARPNRYAADDDTHEAAYEVRFGDFDIDRRCDAGITADDRLRNRRELSVKYGQRHRLPRYGRDFA